MWADLRDELISGAGCSSSAMHARLWFARAEVAIGPLTSDRVMTWTCLNRDPPQIGEFGDRCLAAEAPVSAVLYAPERHLCLVVNSWPIDMANA
jgi:hypothetical protein